MELEHTLVGQTPGPDAGARWLELERLDGRRLRIPPTQGADLLALVEPFRPRHRTRP